MSTRQHKRKLSDPNDAYLSTPAAAESPAAAAAKRHDTRISPKKMAAAPTPRKADPAHPHSHSLSMLGAERYQNQLFTTANAEMFK